MDWMIDMETWDTRPTAVIRSVAVLPFERRKTPAGILLNEVHEFDLRPMVDMQIRDLRTVTTSTQKWWKRTGELHTTDRSVTVSDPRILWNLMRAIGDPEKVWARGGMDFAVFENLWEQYGLEPLWEHYDQRDQRTKTDGVPEPTPWLGRVEHCAAHDCVFQVLHLIEAFRTGGSSHDE